MTEQETDGLYWLSFCDPSIPPADPPYPGGPSFLGCVVVVASSHEDALTRTHVLGVNPGGEVSIGGPVPVPDNEAWLAEWADRLLSAADVARQPGPNGEPAGITGWPE